MKFITCTVFLWVSVFLCLANQGFSLDNETKRRKLQASPSMSPATATPSTATPSITFKPSAIPTFKPSVSFKPTQKPSVGIFGPDNNNVELTLQDQQGIVGSLTILLFIFMAFEVLSPEILFLIALMICMLTQILTLNETLSGFSNESMITIGALFLVIGAVEKSHIVDFMARKTFGMTGSVTMGKVRMYCACFALSIFFNNTPLVAILLPVVKDWGRVRNIAASQLLIPLSFSVLAGSFVSMIGTSSNLTIQGLMQADRGFSFGFFDPAPIGLPLFVVFLAYQVLAGPYLLPHHRSGLLRAVKDKTESLVAEVYVSKDSQFVGKSVETMMNALGIAASRAIKIRRRVYKRDETDDNIDADEDFVNTGSRAVTPVPDSDNIEVVPSSATTNATRNSASRTGSMGLFDLSYVKRAVPFWTPPAVNEGDGFDQVATSPEERQHINNDMNQTLDQVNAHDEDLEAAHKAKHEYMDIIAPNAVELLAKGDVIFISSAQDVVTKLMKSIAGENKGLYILKSNVLALPGYGTELVECVISDTNPFLGKKVGDVSVEFSDKYKAGIIAARSKDWVQSENEPAPSDTSSNVSGSNTEGQNDLTISKPNARISEIGVEMTYRTVDTRGDVESGLDENNSGNNSPVNARSDETSLVNTTSTTAPTSSRPHFIERKTVSDHVIQIGDVILCAVSSKDVDSVKSSRDFFVVSTVGQLPKPITWYRAVPIAVFLVMLVLVATQNIDMCPASLVVACFFFMGGWITYDEIPKLVDLRLLMLLGASLSFAKAMTKSGLAIKIAESIYTSNPSNFEALILIYAITLVMTELISNNAAGALMYPIAVALADKLEVSFKPFAMVVLFACAAGFMCPIGYQTHVMVWGPGGYNFKDFVIFGIVPDLLYWFGSCAIIYGIYSFKQDA